MATDRVARSVADMGRSLLVVLAFTMVVILAGAGRVLLFPGRQNGPVAVEYQTQVHIASRLAGVTFPAPPVSPAGLKATSVNVTGGGAQPVALHIGFVAGGTDYVALEESTGDPATFVRQQLGPTGSGVDGAVSVSGAPWTRRHDNRGDSALTRTVGRITEIVLGTADRSVLVRLAGALRG